MLSIININLLFSLPNPMNLCKQKLQLISRSCLNSSKYIWSGYLSVKEVTIKVEVIINYWENSLYYNLTIVGSHPKKQKRSFFSVAVVNEIWVYEIYFACKKFSRCCLENGVKREKKKKYKKELRIKIYYWWCLLDNNKSSS